MQDDELIIEGAGGQLVDAHHWHEDRPPRAVVQVAHGAAEHALRYRRFAERLVAAGHDVVASDHRGHGRTAEHDDSHGLLGPGGWDAIVDDLHAVTRWITEHHPGTPVVLFGHSMGSFLAQRCAQDFGEELAALVLTGSSGSLEVDDDTMGLVESLAVDAPHQPSEVFGQMFAGFNEPFAGEDAAGATGFEWLSRDDAEVAAYVADPWCGFPLCNRFVAEMLAGNAATWSAEAEARVPTDLPVLVASGGEDPVGGGTDVPGARALADRWEANGVPVTLKVYPGARHEILNEVNRDDVMADIVAWIDDAIS